MTISISSFFALFLAPSAKHPVARIAAATRLPTTIPAIAPPDNPPDESVVATTPGEFDPTLVVVAGCCIVRIAEVVV